MTALIERMQRFVANASVTSSAVRQGPRAVKGVAYAAIEFLSNIDLAGIANIQSFPDFLDNQTIILCNNLPPGAQYWGRARKCINIFFREASYNFLLRDTFELGALDEILETPLDSRVAVGLRHDAGQHRVPRWNTIISLTPEQNQIYQTVAAEVARERYGTYRANLDLWYWRPPVDQPSEPGTVPFGSVSQ